MLRPDLPPPDPRLDPNAGQRLPPDEPPQDVGPERDRRWDPPPLEGFDLDSGLDAPAVPGGHEPREYPDLEMPVTRFPLPPEDDLESEARAPAPAGPDPSPALMTGARTGRVPAQRPGSRYPLCGSGVPNGCIDPTSLVDRNGDLVADNEGVLLDALVGPRRVGPGIVGPLLVGPGIVGHGIVGTGPAAGSDDVSWGDAVTSAAPSPALAPQAPAARPRPTHTPAAAPARQPEPPQQPAPAQQGPTWQERAGQVGAVLIEAVTAPHPLDPFRGALKDVWRVLPGLPVPGGQAERAI